MELSGGCACGSTRYRVSGEPLRVVACHCKDCQLRTGSAFGIGCFFASDDLEITQGSMTVFERTSHAGNVVRIRFCETCGSSVFWETPALPNATGIAGGSFDDTDWIEPEFHVWAKFAQSWTPFPEHAEILQESNLGKSR